MKHRPFKGLNGPTPRHSGYDGIAAYYTKVEANGWLPDEVPDCGTNHSQHAGYKALVKVQTLR